MNNILQLKNLSYKYAKNLPEVLNDINYSFESGKMYAIVGKSGAGKTTLLSLLSGLAKPTGGEILFDGKSIKKIDKYKYRSKYVGVIFQNFNLLSYLNAKENVILSMDISRKKIKNKSQTAEKLLNKVGLTGDDIKRNILKLSGGQQQRVAIARALSYDPHVILADEPTGNLDGETQNEIISILRTLANEGKCVIVVTHSPDVSAAADVVYNLQNNT